MNLYTVMSILKKKLQSKENITYFLDVLVIETKMQINIREMQKFWKKLLTIKIQKQIYYLDILSI